MLLNYSIKLCVKRLESSNEFINIMQRMKKHSYSDMDIKKSVGGNLFNIIKNAW